MIETELIVVDENHNSITLVIHAIENIKISKVIVNDGLAPLDWFGYRGLSAESQEGVSHWRFRGRSSVGRWRHGVKTLS